ncbi:MAG TPA: D-alanyl-D-alanine carboxypeptidase/D-alanyl-D-alanine-endopeptidase [Solirubrobacteraceae bacterium]|nr:D-alanyl-D-alanine carboxypeptidase/D-alanyl-D-alanine-endopeptidase [Solirubrobacteraceae bacterium]
MNASRLQVALATLTTIAYIGLWAPAAPAASSTHGRHPAHPSSASSAQIALSAQLSHELSSAGSQSGAYVYDLTTSTPLFAERSEVARPPASVEKLYTSATALELMGPAATLSTTVLGVGHLGANGVWDGSLYLRGGGDPTFGSTSFIDSHYYGQGASVSALAEQLVTTDGIRSVTGNVYGDESYLDSLRGEPSSNYQFDPFLEGVLSGLAFNRGETGSEKGPHAPAEYAALQLRGALRAAGDTIHGGGAATAPAGATLLATVSSPPLTTLLDLMLPPSDNFFAETLVKDLGARYGGAGTTAAGAAVVRATIASHFDIHPSVVDGSGLSRSDHTSPLQVVMLLSDLSHSPLGTTLRKDLAVAGESGTLSERMRDTPAAGHCQAKTGTLTGASNLAGYCQTANGNVLAFAIFNDGIETGTAHAVQDSMTVTLARY